MSEHNPSGYLAYADRVWEGEDTLLPHLSGAFRSDELITVAERVGLYPGFANVTAFDTGAGVVLVDSGDSGTAAQLHTAVRAFSPARSGR